MVVGTVAIVRSRRDGLDEIFDGITPGQLPRPGEQVGRRRVPESAYTDRIAVQFTPPAGLGPGLVGTVYDGVAEARDVTATIVDLAVRGWVRIKAVEAADTPNTPAIDADNDPVTRPDGPEGTVDTRGHKADWEVIAVDPQPADDELSVMEAHLLNGLFARGPVVRISQLTADFGQVMRDAVQSLYAESVHRGWYPRHPRRTRGLRGVALWGATAGAALVLGVVGLAGLWTGFVSALLVLGTAVAWQVRGRVRPGRTAEGTAVRIQALGFEEYLRTAEADQIRFEEAATIFSRYLPYAIVFGVAEHWAKLFGEVAARAKLEGFDTFDFGLDWIDMVILADLFDVPQLALVLGDGLMDLIGEVDATGIADAVGGGLGAVGDGVSQFIDSVDGLDNLGDGCDGCDFDFDM